MFQFLPMGMTSSFCDSYLTQIMWGSSELGLAILWELKSTILWELKSAISWVGCSGGNISVVIVNQN